MSLESGEGRNWVARVAFRNGGDTGETIEGIVTEPQQLTNCRRGHGRDCQRTRRCLREGDDRGIVGALAIARVALRSETADRPLFVEVRMGVQAAKALASWMLSVPDPDCLDVLDAVGEVANILGGGVSSLVDGPCQLSLPHAVVTAPLGGTANSGGVVRRGFVFGQVVEMTIREPGDLTELLWPGGSKEAGR
jgi:ribosomal protein S14